MNSFGITPNRIFLIYLLTLLNPKLILFIRRKGAGYINEAFFIAIGIRKDGYREILGAMIADSEDSVNWEAFFEDL
ncbi:MAG: transposase, partial [Thermotogae bacterium]|nr:transposase [Thermotogota bacterium]